MGFQHARRTSRRERGCSGVCCDCGQGCQPKQGASAYNQNAGGKKRDKAGSAGG